ncbi:hypothetical protein GCM10022254_52450 [Actinomadura meridiana]|uniref:Cytochrome P450 n=1 Tax=Actinomadura meridiana TaxID=559626 RepID=A0ABP8CEA0_9ACTN
MTPSAACHYDPLAPETLYDPYPVLAELRRTDPVFWHAGMRSWVVTRYDDCVRVLRDHRAFARDPRRAGGVVPDSGLSVQTLDPPHQGWVRSLFMSAVRAQDLGAIESRAYRLVTDRLDGLTGAGSFDVMAELAVPLAVTVVADLLGVQAPPHQEYAAISEAIMRSMDGGLDPAVVEPGQAARRALSDLVASWWDASERPGVLTQVRETVGPAVDPLSYLYVRNTARVMFQGGYSTLAAAAGNVIHTLLARPDALKAMRRAELRATGVEELVRFDGPVQGTTRHAMVGCRIGGAEISPGQKIVALFAAANRDPAAFPDPDQLRLGRTPNRHLGYGWGPHACIGTIAAQAGLRGLVGALADQATGNRAVLVPDGDPVRRPTATLRAFASLPAVLHAPSAQPAR